MNLSLWDERCLLIFMYYTLEHSVLDLRLCCPCALSGKMYRVDSGSLEDKKLSLSFTSTIATTCKAGQDQLVSRDQGVEAVSKRGRGGDKEELKDAFGQVSVVLYSLYFRTTAELATTVINDFCHL